MSLNSVSAPVTLLRPIRAAGAPAAAPTPAPLAAPSFPSLTADADIKKRAVALLTEVQALRNTKAAKPSDDGSAPQAVAVYNRVIAIDAEAAQRLNTPGISNDTKGLLQLVRWAADGKLGAVDRIDLKKNGEASWDAMRQAVALAPGNSTVAQAYARSLIGIQDLNWLYRKIVTSHAKVDLGKETRIADVMLQAFPNDAGCVLTRQELGAIHKDATMNERTALDVKRLEVTDPAGMAKARASLHGDKDQVAQSGK